MDDDVKSECDKQESVAQGARESQVFTVQVLCQAHLGGHLWGETKNGDQDTLYVVLCFFFLCASIE